MICPNCGNEFPIQRLKRDRRKFCSVACKHDSQRKPIEEIRKNRREKQKRYKLNHPEKVAELTRNSHRLPTTLGTRRKRYAKRQYGEFYEVALTNKQLITEIKKCNLQPKT